MNDFKRVYGEIVTHFDFPKTFPNVIILSSNPKKNDYFLNIFLEQYNG